MEKKFKPKAEICDNKKQCRLCKEWIDISLFGTFKDSKVDRRYINSRCKECSCKKTQEWAKDNKQYLTNKWHVDKDSWLKQIREGYGGKCNCCGEANPLFLTIDHVNNDGYKMRFLNKAGHRSNVSVGHYYKTIIKEKFPKHLQLLCWNCNCGRARNKGICPHKI